jgi:hypothetical protein
MADWGSIPSREKAMRTRKTARSGSNFFQQTAAGLLALVGALPAQAQPPTTPTPPPTLTAQLAAPTARAVTAGPSQVFPDGGFPSSPPAAEGGFPGGPPVPEGGIPKAIAKPGPGVPSVVLQPPSAEYGPQGRYPREPQEGPGVGEYYRPVSDPLPPYFYQPSYYERPVVSPRSALVYAPPGYEARDQQVTPGVPEYTPIPVPVPVTPEERERFVTRGIFPGSFLVPGTNTSFRMRGFVRLMALYDFDPIGFPDAFVTNSIPVPQSRGQNLNFAARMSRIAFESWTPTPFQEWTVHTFIEGDFFNGPGQAAGGGGNPFRLRHAFVDYGYFRVGQQNTVFMDASTWPSLVDFQGPAGWANQRRPGALMTLPLTDLVFWAGGIEQPFSDISTNGLGTNVQDVPDFATHLRYETDYGHVQVAGLLRAIGYRPTGGEVTRRSGYGLSLATTFHPWAILCGDNPTRKDNPNALERCRLIGQYTCGWGVARYIHDSVGQGLDGQVDPLTGSFDVPWIVGWVVSYEHWFNEQWLAQVTYSEVNGASNGAQPGTTYAGA